MSSPKPDLGDLAARFARKAESDGIALQKLGDEPDVPDDLTAAREHGIRAVGVLWGIGTEEELLTAGADALAHAPAELAILLAPCEPDRDSVSR